MARTHSSRLTRLALTLALVLATGVAGHSALPLPGFLRQDKSPQPQADPFEDRRFDHPEPPPPDEIPRAAKTPPADGAIPNPSPKIQNPIPPPEVQPVSWPAATGVPPADRYDVADRYGVASRYDGPDRYDDPPSTRVDDDDDQDDPYQTPRRRDDESRTASANPPRRDLPGVRQPPAVTEEETGARVMPWARPIARVGSEVIIEADVIGPVEQQLGNLIQSGQLNPQDVPAARLHLMRQALEPLIDRKMVMEAARRELPAEAMVEFEKRANRHFDKEYLPRMMEQFEVRSRAELEDMLRQAGSSLAQQRKMHFERSIASEWINKDINNHPDVTHDDILAHYREHRDQFTYEARACWEELVVRFDRAGSKAEAWRQLAEMGNRVWHGEPLAEVARSGSHGFTAEQGGKRDWVTKGSLVSAKLDDAIFSLPLNQLSPILEDKDAFYIIRVIDRRPAGVVPFSEAQVAIRQKLRQERIEQQRADFVKKLRNETPIWTIFDD